MDATDFRTVLHSKERVTLVSDGGTFWRLLTYTAQPGALRIAAPKVSSYDLGADDINGGVYFTEPGEKFVTFPDDDSRLR